MLLRLVRGVEGCCDGSGVGHCQEGDDKVHLQKGSQHAARVYEGDGGV